MHRIPTGAAPKLPDLREPERYLDELTATLEELHAPLPALRLGLNWLRRNHDKTPFFLHLEAFDPHEPWDPPKRFLDEYMPDASGPTWWEPPYSNIEVPQSGIDRLRANYAGESMCVATNCPSSSREQQIKYSPGCSCPGRRARDGTRRRGASAGPESDGRTLRRS